MSKKEIYIIGGILIVMAALIKAGYLDLLKSFFQKWEGFSANPYWDVNRWSWGYGTKVPNSINDPNIRPSGAITRERAWNDSLAYLNKDKATLQPLVKVPLNDRQWAALLSFSYNTGSGNAKTIINYINAGNLATLSYQWNRYVYSGGQINQTLVKRRAAEWRLFTS